MPMSTSPGSHTSSSTACWAWHFIGASDANGRRFGVRRWRHGALVIVYALSDELHQAFVPGRHPDFRDILTDAAGAALALFLVVLLERIVRRMWEGRKVSAGD